MDQFRVNTILLDRHIGPAISSLIHKSAFEKYGKYDEKFKSHEDYELWLRFCLQYNCRLYLVPKILVKWRVHKGQLSITTLRTGDERTENIRKHVLSKLDPKLREEYAIALSEYRKKIPFNLWARKVIGNIMLKLLPASVATKVIRFYWSRKGLQ